MHSHNQNIIVKKNREVIYRPSYIKTVTTEIEIYENLIPC